jgi:pSer/pThr/pTyr-binding forkhead associated (FHA) protein
MSAQLVSLDSGPSIFVDKPILLVGRHPECDVLIDSRKVSRRHCCVAQVGDYLVVRDLGSTNGIRINGVRVLEGRLKAGDQLTIGGHSYRVSWDSLPAIPVDPEVHKPNGKSGVRKPVAPRAQDNLESCDEPIPLAEPVESRNGRNSHHDEPYELAQSSEKDPPNSNLD